MPYAGGQRHDSQREFQSRLEQKRMNYDDWKRPDKNPSREHITSVDNPLRHLVIESQPEVEPVGPALLRGYNLYPQRKASFVSPDHCTAARRRTSF
eukprot:624160-Pelagomonas_calceolata.AAC.6